MVPYIRPFRESRASVMVISRVQYQATGTEFRLVWYVMCISHPADESGFSVSGGFDMNGDGLSDFIIGAPEGGTVGEFDGEAYVVFGQVREAGAFKSVQLYEPFKDRSGRTHPSSGVTADHKGAPDQGNQFCFFAWQKPVLTVRRICARKRLGYGRESSLLCHSLLLCVWRLFLQETPQS